MSRKILWVAGALLLSSSAAQASCVLVSGPCETDRYGNTFTTQQNLGGGYSTYRNGSFYSSTGQTLGGSYRERDIYGGTRTYNYDPSSFDRPRRSRGLYD